MALHEGVLQKRGDDSIGLWRERFRACWQTDPFPAPSHVALQGSLSLMVGVSSGGTSNGTATRLPSRPRFAPCCFAHQNKHRIFPQLLQLRHCSALTVLLTVAVRQGDVRVDDMEEVRRGVVVMSNL